jgi:hypothetical protein
MRPGNCSSNVSTTSVGAGGADAAGAVKAAGGTLPDWPTSTVN